MRETWVTDADHGSQKFNCFEKKKSRNIFSTQEASLIPIFPSWILQVLNFPTAIPGKQAFIFLHL